MNFIFSILLFTFVIFNVEGGAKKDKWMEIGKECKEITSATDEDINNMMNKKTPETTTGKCMIACILKKSKIFTEDGKFDEDGNEKIIAEDFADDSDKQDKMRAISNACKEKVNNVSDDDSGCERAAVLSQCTTEVAQEMGYTDDE